MWKASCQLNNRHNTRCIFTAGVLLLKSTGVLFLCQHYITKIYYFKYLMRYRKRSRILMRKNRLKSQTIVFMRYANDIRWNIKMLWGRNRTSCKHVFWIRSHERYLLAVIPWSWSVGACIMIELFIIVGGAYALYIVGMAIATELDYREVNRKWVTLKTKQLF